MCDCDCSLPKQERWQQVRREAAEDVRRLKDRQPEHWAGVRIDIAAHVAEYGLEDDE